MPVITLFGGVFCREDEVVRELAACGPLDVIDDAAVVADAARRSGMAAEKISRAFSAKTSIFNPFDHEKESAVAFLKQAVAARLTQDALLLRGFTALLVPRAVQHALRACLSAELNHRISAAAEAGISEKEAVEQIRLQDENQAAWTRMLFENPDPWAPALYDLLLPMDKQRPAVAAAVLLENAAKATARTTAASRQAAADFRLAADVGAALAREGHLVEVEARSGAVTLSVNNPVLMFARLEEELNQITGRVAGVQSVNTVAGRHSDQAQIYLRHDLRLPARVLLVDDERAFIDTLSERLQIRGMGAAVVYDGHSALELIADDAPEVMTVDLRMPVIDGFEVLRKVKAERPAIEVIVLTGHGSEADRRVCMELGAFAYLEKPVDIDELSKVLKDAHRKVHRDRDPRDAATTPHPLPAAHPACAIELPLTPARRKRRDVCNDY